MMNILDDWETDEDMPVASTEKRKRSTVDNVHDRSAYGLLFVLDVALNTRFSSSKVLATGVVRDRHVRGLAIVPKTRLTFRTTGLNFRDFEKLSSSASATASSSVPHTTDLNTV